METMDPVRTKDFSFEHWVVKQSYAKLFFSFFLGGQANLSGSSTKLIFLTEDIAS